MIVHTKGNVDKIDKINFFCENLSKFRTDKYLYSLHEKKTKNKQLVVYR